MASEENALRNNINMAMVTTIKLPYFDGSNFSNWLYRITCILEEKMCKEAIAGPYATTKEFLEKDVKAKSLIVQSLSDKHLEYVRTANSAKEMINNLKKVFERKSILSSLYIRKKLLTLKCTENEDLNEHFNKFDILIRELSETGSEMKEQDKICHLLLTMSEKYETTITALETTNVELTLEYVKSKLLDAELKFKNEHNKSGQEYSFVGTSKKCFICGDKNHFANQCPKNRNKINKTFRGNYRGRNYNKRGQSSRENYYKQNEGSSHIAAQVAEINTYESKIIYVIDSGATYNMTSIKYMQFMKDIEDIDNINIKIANGEVITVNKKGKLLVKTQEGYAVTIETLIVEKLSHNLLSVKRLIKNNYNVLFYNNIVKISNQRTRQIIYGKNNEGLFTVTYNIEEHALVTAKASDNLWHKRLGHLNYGGLKVLGLPTSSEKCEICAQAKGVRLPFYKIDYPKSKRIGDLIYTDIGGPITPSTLFGEKYYLTIIDDYSHFTEVYTLRYKSEAIDYLKDYINRLNNRKCNVLRIRSDNGGEFNSNEFKRFCKDKGIVQEFTSSYSPQQNGVAERMNRTLMDKVRAILLDSNFAKNMWGEALRYSNYTLNRSPTKALKGDVPAHVFYGKVKHDHLRIFGSKAWAVILPKQGKLSPRAREARMIGYCGNGYRLWDQKKGEIFVSRDVQFDERNYKLKQEDNRSEEYILEDIEKETKNIQLSKTEEELYDLSDKEDDILEPEIQEEQNTVCKNNENIRGKRCTKLPERYNDYEMYMAYALITESDPKSYKEAISQGRDWKEAINKEIISLKNFNVWTECDIPNKKINIIDTKWVFRTKQDGTKRARLVARGFQQDTQCIEGYIYSPVAKMTTIRLSLSHAISNDWEVKQLDIPTAFLNGDIETETYIKVPEGVKTKSDNKILKLNKALYGLKESPRRWNERFNVFCTNIGLKRSKYDVCLYVKENVWLILFVDDILLIGKSEDINKVIKLLQEEFNAKYLGYITSFLGIDIQRSENTITLSQERFI